MQSLADTLKYRFFYSEEIHEYINILGDLPIINTNKRISYFNIPCAFDIETSSFYNNGEKVAIMYIWMLSINGYIILGRTWEDFIKVINELVDKYNINVKNRIIIYVHNLSYEFQFIRKLFKWFKIFSLETRKPVYAITITGIEFRCSYLLSGYSLERLGNELKTYDVKKLVGNLDYSLIRHSSTKLNDKEINYCINDVKVVTAYIQERIDTDGNISFIPLTKTGYVRKFCRNKSIGSGKNRNRNYSNFIKTLTLNEYEYIQLKRAFQGGFTHANPFNVGKVIKDVSSYDFNSSYPSVMISEKFPMSKGESIDIKSSDEFYYNLKLYNCMFDVVFENICSSVFFDNYLSVSRCWGVVNAVINNGRIVKADRLYTTITEQDFFIISNMYKWDEMGIANFIRYKKGYLPTSFIKSILELYKKKTELKNVDGFEYEYSKSKEMLNSAYGMIVTDICRDEIIYNDDWSLEKSDIKKQIEKYNKSSARFLFYPWGVWVTAYARRNLFTGILACNEDYIYSDTDSIKIINKDRHTDYIAEYNENITEKLITALNFHGLSLDDASPTNINGITKQMGIWEYEGTYDEFKTLGAKRYLTKSNEEYKLTVSGLRKDVAIDYIKSKVNNPFDFFNDEMYIPKGFTGKMIHTYIDEERKGFIQDYNGIVSEYSEKSSVHLDDADYSLKLGHEFARFLLNIQTREL